MPEVVVIHYAIPQELHRRAKMRASADGITLRAFVVAALLAAVTGQAYTAEGGRPDGAEAVS